MPALHEGSAKRISQSKSRDQSISNAHGSKLQHNMSFLNTNDVAPVPPSGSPSRNSSRRRQRGNADASGTTPHAYAISFSHKNTGRYFRSSKRHIRWVYGFANSKAIRQGRSAGACRGEEHEVDLHWSLKSGKIRLFWNNKDVSDLCRDVQPLSRIRLSWTTRSGEKLVITANAVAPEGSRQYDMTIDGASFFELPSIRDLGRQASEVTIPEVVEQGVEVVAMHRNASSETMSDLGSDHLEFRDVHEDLDFRLAMVGLNPGGTEIVDELRSELYSSVLESLRDKIITSLPQTEEMVSRAIMNAFFLDTESLGTDHSMSDDLLDADPYQFEVDAILEAHRWMGLYSMRPNADELALLFLQKQIDTVFIRIRTEELTSDAAARILLSVGAVLNLQFATTIPKDSVVIDGIPANASLDDLETLFGAYGSVESPAIARMDSSFGFCRFHDEESAARVVEAAAGSFVLNGSVLRIVLICDAMYTQDKAGSGPGPHSDDLDTPCLVTPDSIRQVKTVLHPNLSGRTSVTEIMEDPFEVPWHSEEPDFIKMGGLSAIPAGMYADF